MRTNKLDQPSSWRAWDGSGFTIHLNSPYPAPQNTEHCVFVSKNEIAAMSGSLAYNTYLGKYLLVGVSASNDPQNPACGTYYSLSDDLTTWTPRKLIWAHETPNPPCMQGVDSAGSVTYPSIIDHNQLTDASDLNFEKSGNRPHLYYIVRRNAGNNRDLLRRPITICETGKPVPGVCP